ncbi:hypothetical protein AALP_AA8G269200 [Arabis alpina]|uniref:Uncharacterized protein n=1 Tax=Arabis alpina TaxID=50452 RepID=A0A087G9P4_ARAAL|nr:hypothetical protein AALP_AA8G269200 [Arabis alpina]
MVPILFGPVLVEWWLAPPPPKPPPLDFPLDLLHVAPLPKPPDPLGSLIVPDLPSPLIRADILVAALSSPPFKLSIYALTGLVVVSLGGSLVKLLFLTFTVCSPQIYMIFRVNSQLSYLQYCTAPFADLGILLPSSLKSLSSISSLERPLSIHCAQFHHSSFTMWFSRLNSPSRGKKSKSNLLKAKISFGLYLHVPSSVVTVRLIPIFSFMEILFESSYSLWEKSVSPYSLEERTSPVSKPRKSSSFMERALLSFVLMVLPQALMPLVLTVQAMFDHKMVLGLKKVDFKSSSLQNSASHNLVD